MTRRRSPDTSNLGFLLAKASQRWNERLAEGFAAAGYADVRPSYGSVLLPLWEQDGLRMGQLAERARLSKQTMTTLVRLCERDGLVERAPDPEDRRATIVSLTARAKGFRSVAAVVIDALEAELPARTRRDLDRALREVMDL
jgi:DNA-binding MarR family transcriptional regulator